MKKTNLQNFTERAYFINAVLKKKLGIYKPLKIQIKRLKRFDTHQARKTVKMTIDFECITVIERPSQYR